MGIVFLLLGGIIFDNEEKDFFQLTKSDCFREVWRCANLWFWFLILISMKSSIYLQVIKSTWHFHPKQIIQIYLIDPHVAHSNTSFFHINSTQQSIVQIKRSITLWKEKSTMALNNTPHISQHHHSIPPKNMKKRDCKSKSPTLIRRTGFTLQIHMCCVVDRFWITSIIPPSKRA